MSIKFTVDASGVKTTLDQLKKTMQEVAKVPNDAYKHFVAITPIDTGNARRSTSLQGSTINANYPYAKPLDNGHSKQAPRGMVKPTEEFIKRRLRQITGK